MIDNVDLFGFCDLETLHRQESQAKQYHSLPVTASRKGDRHDVL
jgi:hypothetical protein